MAWLGCSRPGTSLTQSVAQSLWLIYGLRKVVSARQCVPMSGDCSLRRSRARLILRGTADMYVGMSELYREHNDLHAATQHLLRSKELGEHTGFPQNRYRWCVAMARIREAQGDLDGALDLLHEAERLYVSDFFPNVRPVAALKTRVWVAQGRLGEALDWAREQGLSARGRPQLPARVRAHHPGQGAPGPV